MSLLRAEVATAAVMLSSGAVAGLSSVPSGLVSMAVGLIAVWLSRWVFVSRENRQLGRPQRWNDTLPLTLVAMLLTGVVVYDRNLGLSAAAFTGLGVGWAAVLLLDVLGERVLNMLRAGFAVPVDKKLAEHLDRSGHGGKVLDSDVKLPTDMIENLQRIDREDDEHGKR